MSTIDQEQVAAGTIILDNSTQEMHSDKELNAMNSGSSSDASIPVNSTENYNDSVQYDLSYKVGVAENRNLKFRKTMEDVHTYVENFNNKLDWGYFAIFDGHAGNQASKWCGANLHNLIEQQIQSNEKSEVSDMSKVNKMNGANVKGVGETNESSGESGTTANSAELTGTNVINGISSSEDQTSGDTPESIGTNDEAREPCKDTKEADAKEHKAQDLKQGEIEDLNEQKGSHEKGNNDNNNSHGSDDHHHHNHDHNHHNHHRASLKDIFQQEEDHGGHSHEEQDVRDILNNSFVDADKYICENLPGHSGCTAAVCVIRWEVPVTDTASSRKNSAQSGKSGCASGSANEDTAEEELAHKRMLYTANVGDTRIVLMRDGKAIRLTYDHKASDQYEMKRVEKAGGLIMKSRVNGMLAVTRSMGDKFFDKLVISNPFTTSVELTSKDQFLIIACDGLWDVVEDQEACDLINDNIHDLDPSKAAKFLVDYAMQSGTTDNITVMVIFFSTYEED
ncbi:hypothetical protein ACO0RG_001450 [Hanseniaspora osmophila]|uniref:Protein phosphatase 2C 1 n=1 Tax=Hanseniaspora osmophila TaxID=56408 RepID=A0A1E5R0M7_9ASCO|nr:Protein phosphatase 2C 1 [Hanseniaspora osmophila]